MRGAFLGDVDVFIVFFFQVFGVLWSSRRSSVPSPLASRKTILRLLKDREYCNLQHLELLKGYEYETTQLQQLSNHEERKSQHLRFSKGCGYSKKMQHLLPYEYCKLPHVEFLKAYETRKVQHLRLFKHCKGKTRQSLKSCKHLPVFGNLECAQKMCFNTRAQCLRISLKVCNKVRRHPIPQMLCLTALAASKQLWGRCATIQWHR